MNESRGADGNSWTTPTTWKGTTWKRPVRVVEHAQPEQVAESQRVVGDRLLRDEDPVGRRAQPVEHLGGAAAEEVGVAQRRAAGERARVDPERVLEVRADVGVRVVDGGDARDAGQRGDPRASSCCRDRAGRCGHDDVGAERQLGVDARLLVVGGGEDAEVDAEGEQEPDDEQAAVDRGAAPAGAGEQEAAPRRRPLAGGPRREPGRARGRAAARAAAPRRSRAARARGTCRRRARASGSSRG